MLDETCPDCGADVVESMEFQRIEYDHKESPTVLTVLVPVWTCTECGFQYTDWRGEDIRTEAVNRYLVEIAKRS